MLRLEEARPASFAAAITEARAGVMAGLGAASMESYRRAYPFLLKLHSLRYVAVVLFLFFVGMGRAQRGRKAKRTAKNILMHGFGSNWEESWVACVIFVPWVTFPLIPFFLRVLLPSLCFL